MTEEQKRIARHRLQRARKTLTSAEILMIVNLLFLLTAKLENRQLILGTPQRRSNRH